MLSSSALAAFLYQEEKENNHICLQLSKRIN